MHQLLSVNAFENSFSMSSILFNVSLLFPRLCNHDTNKLTTSTSSYLAATSDSQPLSRHQRSHHHHSSMPLLVLSQSPVLVMATKHHQLQSGTTRRGLPLITMLLMQKKCIGKRLLLRWQQSLRHPPRLPRCSAMSSPPWLQRVSSARL